MASISHDVSENGKNILGFENDVDESRDTVKSKCNNLRSDIEVDIQNVIKKVNKEKIFLLNRIDLFEKKFTRDVDEKLDAAKIVLYFQQNKIDEKIKSLKEKNVEFKQQILNSRDIFYKKSDKDVTQVVGTLAETIFESRRSFNFLEFLSVSIEPINQYSINVEMEINEAFNHHLIAFNLDRIVLCLSSNSHFQLRLMRKKGDLIQIHTFHSPSEFIAFCANSTRLFVLVKQHELKILYEFDQDLVLRRVKEVNSSCIKLSCNHKYIYLLIKKSICSFCGYCFEIHSDSIQEIERGTFNFRNLGEPNINTKHNISSETELELYSQDEDTFVFYINDSTKIARFCKDKPDFGIIEVRHKIASSDTYIYLLNDHESNEQFRIFFKSNNAWYLVDKNGEVIKTRQCDNLNETDKFCLTTDGSLVIVSRDLNVKLY
jgi:hypothetical protein